MRQGQLYPGVIVVYRLHYWSVGGGHYFSNFFAGRAYNPMWVGGTAGGYGPEQRLAEMIARAEENLSRRDVTFRRVGSWHFKRKFSEGGTIIYWGSLIHPAQIDDWRALSTWEETAVTGAPPYKAWAHELALWGHGITETIDGPVLPHNDCLHLRGQRWELVAAFGPQLNLPENRYKTYWRPQLVGETS